MSGVTTTLAPISVDGLKELGKRNRAHPADKTLKVKTVCEGKFRSLNCARDLDAFGIDALPAWLGDNTAPNPSEIVLGALDRIDLMRRSNQRLGHVNQFLDDQADDLALDLQMARERTYALADRLGGGTGAVEDVALIREVIPKIPLG